LEPGPICILLAEDEEAIRRAYARSLAKCGYSVIEAVDGVDALNKATEYPGEIHVLITDVNMPKMDGHQLARHFKMSRPDVPIIIISGLGQHHFPPDAVHYSDAALVKPVRTPTLLGKLEELLRGHSASQPASA